MISILALSGSLRKVSLNSAFLRAATRLAPAGMAVEVFDGMGRLPLFNPDLEAAPPEEVVRFREAVAAAHALLICSPEYAHGVTGTMKHALDWLVSFPPFAGKPVAVVNTSPTAHHADAALREILKTMSADLLGSESKTLALLGSSPDADSMARTPRVARVIQEVLHGLGAAVR